MTNQNAERVKNYHKRKREAGLKLVAVYVPQSCEDEIKQKAAELTEDYLDTSKNLIKVPDITRLTFCVPNEPGIRNYLTRVAKELCDDVGIKPRVPRVNKARSKDGNIEISWAVPSGEEAIEKFGKEVRRRLHFIRPSSSLFSCPQRGSNIRRPRKI